MQKIPDIRPVPQSMQTAFAEKHALSCAWFAMCSTPLVEIGLTAAPDLIVIDQQHGLWERTALEAVIGQVRYQVPMIVQVGENSAQAIAEALDAGSASALVPPLIESADEARRAVSFGRYPPFGQRSAGSVRPLISGMAAMKNDGERISIGVMIETVAGVEQVEAIAAVEGLGYLFIGTGDLSLSRDDAAPDAIEQDCAHILKAARAGLRLRRGRKLH
ncbi:MAG: hypothetical protein CBARDCOR_0731 [uncultured Caballeronia sp.]|nr:MAG: hypothetical protein CBARDCOR_0731 [uncultured Caballeronia sp.]